ncbi:enoyl-CoA hydratase/isomerase family protein [Streptomyces roseoverticillatus]|uniref:enoyl-CoA hydratase/isomerase family protein n=1 Tax=Streptomyces roseoverticillatus TaxID=66429 RepID=UPI001F396CBC|nr:enoyl-CoA hydratase/isomerase family protein [Streptomyces roseoverticillatus]MCF3101583.1 enoyl-CoA hydratase/isomerase family protein [Streptomyces roseoverticillatus]
MTTDDDAVLLRREGHAGRITLNRPRALNALTHAMVRRIAGALDAWEHDAAVTTVVLDGAGERGLCAGGDVRAVHDDVLAAGGAGAREFWRDEYRLNARIAAYPKPYVALMDGLVMGGGVGLSAHGGIRVVTERSSVAMPETGIGFAPDVGGTFLLSRAPGELGTHLALTTARMGPGDAVHAGFADHFVPAARLAEFTAALAETDPAEAVRAFAAPAPASGLAAHQGWIDRCYAADTVEEIVGRLTDSGVAAAEEAAEAIRGKSPTALKVTLSALRRARLLPGLAGVLEQEYRVMCASLADPDLLEGIRAQVVDKDRRPRWHPAKLEDVTDADVARHFAATAAPALGL